MPPFQICRKGLEQLAVISKVLELDPRVGGQAEVGVLHDAVICVSIVTINSTFGLTFLIMP
jgi:hypothetical protein